MNQNKVEGSDPEQHDPGLDKTSYGCDRIETMATVLQQELFHFTHCVGYRQKTIVDNAMVLTLWEHLSVSPVHH